MIRLKTFDWSLVVTPLILAVISIATIYTVTYVTVGSKLAISQLIYFVIGFGLLFLFSWIDYRQYRGLAIALFLVGFLLLVPLFPVWSSKIPFVICEFNACRWIDLGFFRLQPAELFKVIVVILLAALLSRQHVQRSWPRLLWYLVLLAIPAVVVMEQPDLGTAIIVGLSGLAVLLYGKFPWWAWLVLLLVALVAAPIGWQRLKPYQQKRIHTFLHPEKDPHSSGYNVRQSEIAVGSGGLTGRGLGQGSQSQLNFLPVAHTDFIFAGYAESTGFVGSVLLVAIYVFLVWRAYHVAELAKDDFGRYVAIGIAAMFAAQVFINIGMNIRLMPVTGVPLPFMSYGGTSIFLSMMALGVLQSITIRHRKIDFS